MSNSEKQVPKKQKICPHCKGSGEDPLKLEIAPGIVGYCTHCEGTGKKE